ncbi:rab11 family-interacting protein 3-like [Halichondria panicea]|uniref:rab11 family-interacting protein 3-like n=1 Tax=Halichondria panicea TaxID=6063 RepID=UPI00312BBBEB
MGSEVDDSLKQGVDHLKTIFDLCDRDKDGCISAQDFKSIGLEHFGETQEVDMLIHEMDPANSQHISFSMFCQGIETYILEHHQLPGSSSASLCSLLSFTEDNSNAEVGSTGGYDSAFSSEDIYPLDHRFTAYLSNGYHSSAPKGECVEEELVLESSEETDSSTRGAVGRSHSSSSPDGFYEVGAVSVSRESPTLMARHLQRRHQLMVAESPSQSSTPAELADQEVSKLSDQLSDLTSRLEDLQEDHRDSEGLRSRLKRENVDLKTRLEEYESQLRDTEENNEKMLNDSQNLLNSSLVKVRHESEQKVLDLQYQLEVSKEQTQKMKDAEFTLKAQLSFVQEELSSREDELSETDDGRRRVEEELRRTREQLRTEREAWSLEGDVLRQEVHERDCQVQQLQCECEEAQKERDSQSITASDMGREIDTLKKELELAHTKNEEMQARFLQEGKELLARNKDSLAAEMDNASKDEILKALQDSEERNLRLKRYIDGLLSNIIEKYPELLEIH